MPRVSVIIPTMNEEASIGNVLDEVHRALAAWDPEVLIVDTDSHDRTREIAAAKGARVVDEPRRGYGRAYKTGFAAANGDILATLDADFTYPADRIPEFARLVASGEAEFVSGDRLSGLAVESMSGMHRVGNAILNATFRLLFRHPIRDCQSGMWVFRRAVLDSLPLHSNGMAFSEELKIEVIRRGRKFREVPIAYRARVGEKKIRSVRDAMKNEVWLFRKRFGWTRPE
ncbi:MAG TPA: glycosyltransferase family 2 protein [Thermoplasmata archaeon]|nr:glycosyltransferase family 2 protein [Thermoplasmata archaeon]